MADGNNGGLIARATQQRADGRVPSLRPILFNTEMVQALCEYRKTATRRLIRWDRNDVIKMACAKGKNFGPFPENEPLPEQLMTWYMINFAKRPCEVGDVLWVRETWDFLPCIVCRPNSECCEIATDAPDQMETADGLTDGCFLYRAEGETPVFSTGHRWRPSIHMPRQAARIFLRVAEVFPERLQESFDEASLPMRQLAAEGIQIYERCRICIGGGLENRDCRGCALYDQPRWEFSRLWDRTVRKDRRADEGWAANPWVWVIRFERCERPEGWPG